MADAIQSEKREPTPAQKLAEDYWHTFAATDHGRRVLRDLQQRCGWGQSVFGVEPHATSYRAGRQDVANEIMQRLNERAKDQ